MSTLLSGNHQKSRIQKLSDRAVCARINPKLRLDYESLRKARSARVASAVGEYFIVGTLRNVIIRQQVDIEGLARELGVLRPGEVLEQGA